MTQTFKLLSENVCQEAKIETELDEKTNNKKMYLSGIGLQANIRNKNGRVYPESILYESVDKHINEFMPLGRCVGELEHPKENSHEINLANISHKFVDVKKEGGNVLLKALILDTTSGQQLRNIIEGDITIGFSSRCLGNVKNINGNNVVQEGLRIISLADAVFNQSASEALASAIYENKEWVYTNGLLIEKDLSQDLDEYKYLIKTTKKSDRAKVFKDIVTDYFKKIKLNI